MVRQEGTARLFCNKFLLGQKQMKNISPNFKQNEILQQDNPLVEFPFLMTIIFQRM